MIKVKLIDWKNLRPLDMASHAALTCYQAETPEIGKTIDVENRLFKTGHHTTLQHTDFTFLIEGIAVSDITFGMHLASPFYNSDQKSGRFCAKMFVEPDFEKIEQYIESFWPEIGMSISTRNSVMNYIKLGVDIYQRNIQKATEVAGKFLKNERPFANDKYIEQNAPKIAQEQMRMFIPTIFPTSFDFTVNLTALIAMWESAWTPAMKFTTNMMVLAVLEKFSELAFMFNEDRRTKGEWSIKPRIDDPRPLSTRIKYEPGFELLEIFGKEDFDFPDSKIMHPVDKLHFYPEMMNNSIGGMMTQIEISVATMGQDQRHRTIRRGKPEFTGNFYLPPILAHLKLEDEALILIDNWFQICRSHILPSSLAMTIAPYGAMVTYRKNGSFNAIAHEQGKRLCWCAQEEIYHAGKLFRSAAKNVSLKFSRIFEPPCYSTGKCTEGVRYCGRDIKFRNLGDSYFPKRKI